MEHKYLELEDGRRIAYRSTSGTGTGIVFLGGLVSDMTGTKAQFLEEWAVSKGRPYLRFDYTGHGTSSGRFEDGGVGDWARDAHDGITRLTSGPQILVGSSMGGWASLIVAKHIPERIHALIGIAAAPDFSEDLMWAGLTADQQTALMRDGSLTIPSDYSDEPYTISRHMIENSRENLVLRSPLILPFPVRLLHGTADTDVPVSVATRLLAHADCADMRLTLVKDADHRFSTQDCLELIARNIMSVS